MEQEQRNRDHRAKQAGSKANRQARQRKKKNLGSSADEKRHNPKAFTFSGGVVSVQRRVQRTLDKAAAKEHKPVIDKTPAVEPPYTVVVQGPPRVGKSLLIRCLARHYARRIVGAVRGPVTLVASKRRRLTFVECPNDASGMLDAAKVADIALLLIDAQYGFEMETFEFINMMQTHGLPRVIGVLTHLDAINDKKTLKRKKKELKARFWAELYDGAKLFFLSGLRNGKYQNREILNLARFVSVQKIRPLQWRTAHPYLLALKADYKREPFEGTDVEASKQHQKGEKKEEEQQQRLCVFYGYVRGAVLRLGHSVHIPGAGDFPIVSVTKCEDPCPAPCAEELSEPLTLEKTQEASADGVSSGAAAAATKRRKSSRAARALKEKQRCIFAPDCDIGGMRLDDNAMYIHLPDTKVGFTPKAQLIKEGGGDRRKSDGDSSESSSSDNEASERDEKESEAESELSSDDSTGSSSSDSNSEDEEENMGPAIRMVRELQGAPQQLTRQLQSQKLQLLDSSTRCIDAGMPPPRRILDAQLTEEPTEHVFFDEEPAEEDGPWKGTKTDSDTDSSASDSQEEAGDRVVQHIQGSSASQHSLADLLYGHPKEASIGFSDGRKKTGKRSRDGKLDLFEEADDSTCGSDEEGDAQRPTKEKRSDNSFLFGNLPLPPNSSGLSPDFDSGDAPAEEAAAVYRAMGIDPDDPSEIEAFWTPQLIAAVKRRFFITGGWKELEQAKEAAKQKPAAADEATDEQEEQRKKEEQQQQGLTAAHKMFEGSEEAMGGFAIGTYVKIHIANLPQQWLESLDSSRPVILGGLNAGELQCTFMLLRVRKHRWSPRILKSNDPLLFSAGWRRFQSLPVYAMEDRGETRIKYLKYTPEHLHCLAYIYAPSLPPSTPLLAIRDTRAIASFRIAATGITLQTNPEPKIEKKLKLIGEANRIFKNTAFIKGMFNSDLEVNRCIGAKIQTASGIRGQIKKAVGTDGTFRASFEDKILMSDLVICKTWIKVSPRPFFNPVLDVESWRRLRTQAEIRQEKQLPLPYKDSNLLPYGGRVSVQRKFNPIKIPKTLALTLPFHSRLKLQAPTSRLKKLKGKKLQEEKDLQKPLVSAYDKRVAALLQRLQTIRNAREEQRRAKQLEKLEAKIKTSNKVEATRQQKQHEIRKKRYVKKGRVEMGMRKRLKLGGTEED